MSVSSAQNFVNPPPVPDSLTLMSTPGWSLLNSSAAASEIGRTVLDPSITIEPVRAAWLAPALAAVVGAPAEAAVVGAAADGAVLAPPDEQAASAKVAIAARAPIRLVIDADTMVFPPVWPRVWGGTWGPCLGIPLRSDIRHGRGGS